MSDAERRMEKLNAMADELHARFRARQPDPIEEARALITELLPLAERMARAAEVLTDGHTSEHQPLIDRATEWLRRMP
jgi:hypothetical protein